MSTNVLLCHLRSTRQYKSVLYSPKGSDQVCENCFILEAQQAEYIEYTYHGVYMREAQVSPLPRKCSFAGRKMFLLRQVCITCTVHVPTLQYPCGHPTFVLVSIMTTYFDTLRTVRRSVVAKI